MSVFNVFFYFENLYYLLYQQFYALSRKDDLIKIVQVGVGTTFFLLNFETSPQPCYWVKWDHHMHSKITTIYGTIFAHFWDKRSLKAKNDYEEQRHYRSIYFSKESLKHGNPTHRFNSSLISEQSMRCITPLDHLNWCAVNGLKKIRFSLTCLVKTFHELWCSFVYVISVVKLANLLTVGPPTKSETWHIIVSVLIVLSVSMQLRSHIRNA